MRFGRRVLLAGLGGAALAGCTRSPASAPLPQDDGAGHLAALEQAKGGRLGVAIVAGDGSSVATHRADERFTMCSTFKLPLAAHVLSLIDAGKLRGDRMIPYTEADLMPHAPVTRAHVSKGAMTVLALAEAAQVVSDNPAANLLLREIGGPAAYTAWLRAIGDDVTRLDRYEPELNRSHGDDVRDTTSPLAMARTVGTILNERTLGAESRERLIGWMVATQTGTKRLRAGLPAYWRAGDKTGTGGRSSEYATKFNDVAIVWAPTQAPPSIVSAFYEAPAGMSADAESAHAEAVLAEVGRIAARMIVSRG